MVARYICTTPLVCRTYVQFRSNSNRWTRMRPLCIWLHGVEIRLFSLRWLTRLAPEPFRSFRISKARSGSSFLSWNSPLCFKNSLILEFKEFQLFGFLVEFYKRDVLERLVTSSRGMFAGSYRGRQNSAPTPRSYWRIWWPRENSLASSSSEWTFAHRSSVTSA